MRLASEPSPRGRGPKWIDVATAAKRSELSPRTIQQLCAEKWLAEGLARSTPTRGGRPRWQVREDADERLAPVKFAAQLPFDATKYRTHELRTAQDRKRILDLWSETKRIWLAKGYTEEHATALFLADLYDREKRRVSRPTLFRWERCYRQQGLEGLIDGRGARAVKSATEDPFLAEVQRLYLNVRKLKLPTCHEIVSMKAEENGWQSRSIHQCRRAIKRLPKAVVLRHRGGKEAYTNEAEPFIERDYSTLRSNEEWCGDHHQFDVMVSHGGQLVRPWITAWMDMRSRKIVGWQILATNPNTDSILAAFGDGARACGVPEGVYIDNGKDYDSYALNGRTKQQRRRRVKVQIDEQAAGGMFASLGVRPTFCWAYHGQSKPIERFFGTAEQVTPVWPTYCGRSPAERPEDLQRQIDRGKAPSLAEFTQWFAAWLDGYHADAHTGNGMNGKSPNQVFADNLLEKRVANPTILDLLLLKVGRPVKVGQNGVRHNGLSYGQFDQRLIERLGQEVILRVDPKDISFVLVWTPDGSLVCRAKANQQIPANATAEELKEAIKAKRQARRTVTDYFEKRPRLHEDLPDLLVRAKARAAAASTPPDAPAPEPVIKPVRNPFKDSLPALQQAMARTPKAASDAVPLSFDQLAKSYLDEPVKETPRSAANDLVEVMNQLEEEKKSDQRILDGGPRADGRPVDLAAYKKRMAERRAEAERRDKAAAEREAEWAKLGGNRFKYHPLPHSETA